MNEEERAEIRGKFGSILGASEVIANDVQSAICLMVAIGEEVISCRTRQERIHRTIEQKTSQKRKKH
jgi:hypothetical protein